MTRQLSSNLLFVVASLLHGCTRPNPDFCTSSSDCKNTDQPFCDVNGEFDESGHIKNSCIPFPAGCPVEECGCTPTAIRCEGDQLATCNADGHSETLTACALGCSASDSRCESFEPTNDLGGPLAAAADEADVVFPASAKIDTDSGSVVDAANLPIVVKSVVVTQGQTSIRVFLGKSFVFHDVVVKGAMAMAAVAPGTIQLDGTFDASASVIVPGPGAQSIGACVGQNSEQVSCSGTPCGPGASGGGGAAAGGNAGHSSSATTFPIGGSVATGFSPLVGGCRGGEITTGATVLQHGGAGGGAIQLVSLSEIVFSDTGVIDVGAGGGQASAGGGSGGVVVLEAPTVRFDSASTGLAANGGAGGACSANGADAMPGGVAAIAPACGGHGLNEFGGGNGATTTTAAGNGSVSMNSALFGGGGGALGRAQIATKDGTFDTAAGPAINVAVSTATLVIQ